MLKFAATTLVALAAFAAPAFAAESWNITEEGIEGIKFAQGKWWVKTEGDKLTGEAALNRNAGDPLTYKIEGVKSGEGYEISLLGRTDGKNNCVWSARVPASKHGLVGEVKCDGKPALVIRAAF